MFFYRLILVLALPALLLRAALSGPKGAVGERLGLRPGPNPGGQRLWLHGASVGELTSARGVLERLLAARPGLQVLVTVNTATARAMVAGWGLPGVQAALAPLDGAGAPGRVIARWRPQALILVENELWPARLAAARRAKVPVLVIGARLSPRSAARWARLPGLVGPMMRSLDWVSAQDAGTRNRLVALGLPPGALGPDLDLKALVARQAKPPEDAPKVPGPAPRAQVLLAASTHVGEEAIILRAFAGQSRFSHLILAPRHPDRGDELARLMAAQGTAFGRRSTGQTPSATAPLFLADTLGEMDLWYAMAGACLIGGTLVDKGGHTPFEPGQHGCALLHGPSTRNFADIFARLDAADAAMPIGRDDLAGALQSLAPDRQVRLAQAAAPLLAPPLGLEQMIEALMQHAALVGPDHPPNA